MFKFILLCLITLQLSLVQAGDRVFRSASGTDMVFQAGGTTTQMTLATSGLVTLTGGLTIGGSFSPTDINASGDLSVTGTTTLSGLLNASGTTTISGLLNVTATATFSTAVSFGTNAEPTSASVLVQFVSTVAGILLPRMTTPQRDNMATTSSEGGLMVFTVDATSTSPDIFDGAAWYSALPITSLVRVRVANAFGSGSTKVRRWTTLETLIGTDIVYTDDSTLGGVFILQNPGYYCMNLNGSGANTASVGVSLDTTELTTNIQSLSTGTDRLCMSQVGDIGIGSCSFCGFFQPDAVIRVHGQGTTAVTDDHATFVISKIGVRI